MSAYDIWREENKPNSITCDHSMEDAWDGATKGLEPLIKQLSEYTKHTTSCKIAYKGDRGDGHPCTCGLDELKLELKDREINL